jgi:hypothetical protein
MEALWKLADFVRKLRRRMRFGKLSRAPLKMLRFELRGDNVECEWMLRPPDVWDAELQPRVRDYQASSQALHDAVSIRKMIFSVIPEVSTAELRAYRQPAREPPHLVIRGAVTRDAPAARIDKLPSLAMRARLLGFQFRLHDGVLVPFETAERELEKAM